MRLLSTILVLISFIVSTEAFSQVRRGPRYNPRPPGRPLPPYRRPMPMPRPFPMPALVCSYADLYNQNFLVHRFFLNSDCHQALVDLRRSGKFCDNASLFDRDGNLIMRYRFQSRCRQALATRYRRI